MVVWEEPGHCGLRFVPVVAVYVIFERLFTIKEAATQVDPNFYASN
jgi:hypothetical protein